VIGSLHSNVAPEVGFQEQLVCYDV